ncbi:MAG: cytochrome P450 [Luteolibacter sp.]|uniref:cytochrome P450 n=1 Tax=Luteolibacter sp. TaxID=1962973 RepID=UPI003267376E
MSAPSKRKAPGPPGNFLLGNLRDFRSDVLGLVMKSAAEYGDIVRCRLGPNVIHLLNHPDHVEHVLQRRSANYDKQTRSSDTIRSISGESLLTASGEFWKRQRRMDQPAFHHQQIAGFTRKMTDAAENMLDRWQNHSPPGSAIDIASEMSRLTYSIVGRTLFSFDTGTDAEVIEQAMWVMLPHVFKRLGHIVQVPDWFPSPANRRFRKSLAEVDRVVYQIIARHREAMENGTPDNDLLAMLIQARDPETEAALSDTQLRNETITFLLAGHETTANALTWTFHLLSQHPEVERQLIDEIRSVLGDRTPVLEDMPKLTYTKRVIQESMRLYPPIWIIERHAIDEDEIGGFHIPAGSSVVISPYALHRHPAFWERPEDFDPSRFESPPPEAYIPFGAGPRFCIGHEFAMLEARLITVMVMQAYQLRMVPGHPVEPMPDITLRSRHGMMMTLHPRRNSDLPS